MHDDKKTPLNTFGALWLNRSKSGNLYLTGKLYTGNKIVAFPRDDLKEMLENLMPDHDLKNDSEFNPKSPIIKLYEVTHFD